MRPATRPLIRAAVLVLATAVPVLTEPAGSQIDTRYYYRLTNQYLGEALSLDTAPDAPNTPRMAESGDYSGQNWRFQLHDGCYRLTNMHLGKDRSLDTHSGGKNDVFMGDTGDYSGQCWYLRAEDDGWFRLTNMFLGTSRSLDTSSGAGHEPFMGDSGNYSGQFWKFTRLGRVD